MYRELVAAKRRLKVEQDRDVTQAWMVAALTRGTKGLPKLETLLAKSKGPQTVSQQRMALQMIFGERKKRQQATKERR